MISFGHTARLHAFLCVLSCTSEGLLAQGWKQLFWEDTQGLSTFWRTNPNINNPTLRAKVVQDSVIGGKISALISWNAQGMPLSIKYPGAYVSEFVLGYNSNGMVTDYEEHYSTGLLYKDSYVLNARNQVISVKSVSGEGRPVFDASISYGLTGKLKRIDISYHDSTIVDAMLLLAQGMRMPINVRYRYRHKGARMYEENLDTGSRYTYTFNRNGQLTQLHYGQDLIIENTYDSCGGLATSRSFQQNTGVLLEELRVQRSQSCALVGYQHRLGHNQTIRSLTVVE